MKMAIKKITKLTDQYKTFLGLPPKIEMSFHQRIIFYFNAFFQIMLRKVYQSCPKFVDDLHRMRQQPHKTNWDQDIIFILKRTSDGAPQRLYLTPNEIEFILKDRVFCHNS